MANGYIDAALLPEGAIVLTRAEIDALNKHNEKVKRELSREIFEEIEKWLTKGGDLMIITAEKFAELKKKYTEGEE